MSVKLPTGKLAFAYRTIANLEARIAELESISESSIEVQLPPKEVIRLYMPVDDLYHAQGWNACLDKVKELNQ